MYAWWGRGMGGARKSSRCAPKPRRGTPRRYKDRGDPSTRFTHVVVGGRGNLREEPRRPRPYSRHGGEIVAGYDASTIICAHERINGNA